MPLSRPRKTKSRSLHHSNNIRKLREHLLMSKSELAEAAGLSVLTVTRVEKGASCRMATKRKIIKALGFSIHEKEKVFGQN